MVLQRALVAGRYRHHGWRTLNAPSVLEQRISVFRPRERCLRQRHSQEYWAVRGSTHYHVRVVVLWLCVMYRPECSSLVL